MVLYSTIRRRIKKDVAAKISTADSSILIHGVICHLDDGDSCYPAMLNTEDTALALRGMRPATGLTMHI